MEVQLIEDQAVVMEEDGLRVRVRLQHGRTCPELTLQPLNCDLEGDEPGHYYLTNEKEEA